MPTRSFGKTIDNFYRLGHVAHGPPRSYSDNQFRHHPVGERLMVVSRTYAGAANDQRLGTTFGIKRFTGKDCDGADETSLSTFTSDEDSTSKLLFSRLYSDCICQNTFECANEPCIR